MSSLSDKSPTVDDGSSTKDDVKEKGATGGRVEDVKDDNARTVVAFIRDKSFVINIADGSQTVEWLADVVLFKYKRNQFEKMHCRGVKCHNQMLDMSLTIASQVENGHDVYILLDGDEDVDKMFGDEV